MIILSFSKMWEAAGRPDKFYLLDIGCNDGTLSLALMDHVERELAVHISQNCFNDSPKTAHERTVPTNIAVHVLGIDIDGELIARANSTKAADAPITTTTTKYGSLTISKHADFVCFDVMKSACADSTVIDSDQEPMDPVRAYLFAQRCAGFHFISLFSVTMWVHLNYGDSGLLRLFATVLNLLQRGDAAHSANDFALTGSILVEPQPWKCYKTAKKRCKSNNLPFPPHMMDIQIKDSVRHTIDCFTAVQLASPGSRSDAPVELADVSAAPTSNDLDKTSAAATALGGPVGCTVLDNESCWGRSMLLFSIHTSTTKVAETFAKRGNEYFSQYCEVVEGTKLAGSGLKHQTVSITAPTSGNSAPKKQKIR